MKKLISLLMILAVLLSLCACGPTNEPDNESTDPSVEATEASTEGQDKPGLGNYTPEQLYGHIDQTKPNGDGVYKIWNEIGVANMANDPAGNFELLCNVDMQGAALSPIGTEDAPFTGKIDGKNFIISNFTLSGEGQAVGFVGVNEGTVQDLQLEGVTITTAAANKNVGTLAGVNDGTILRSKASGTIHAEAAAADAVIGGAIGSNTGDFTNSTVTVDVLVSSAEAATVGGLAGTTSGGKIEYIESYGAITVTGENKTVGLFAGAMENTPITNCVFVGEDNSLNGELFTNLATTEDASIITGCVMRDNTPVEMSETEQKVRNTVAERMRQICGIPWKVRQTLESDDGIYTVGMQYYGFPYSFNGASLARMQYMIDEEGYIKDFAYDMHPRILRNYMSNDCSQAVSQALWSVSNSTNFFGTNEMYPCNGGIERGCIPLGDWEYEGIALAGDSQNYINATDEQTLYEAYAMLRTGDFYVYTIKDVGGHTRMATGNAVVVRDQNGLIDPNFSYVLTSEQGSPTLADRENMIYSTCRVDYKYTFANLKYDGAVPLTCEELQTGQMEPATCEFTGGTDGKMGMITGTVKTNYYLDYVDMVITDSKGNEVFNHRIFPGAHRRRDSNTQLVRMYIDSMDLELFMTPLSEVVFTQGETYTYKVTTTNSPGDVFEVTEGTFTQ